MKKIIAYRFSSFGDVLLTIPVVVSFLKANTDYELILFTRPKFSEYFPEMDRLRLIPIDLENEYGGVSGLLKLHTRIRNESDENSIILDLHSVIRTRFLNILLKLSGHRVFKLMKPRKLRRQFLKGTKRNPLPSALHLYQNVFYQAGFEFIITPPFFPASEAIKTNKTKIGIAPFAKHKTKTWPLQNFNTLIRILSKLDDIEFYFLGSKGEIGLLKEMSNGNLLKTLDDPCPSKEIELIKNLDILVSMDSANMHLADILGTKVISIWGGTHPEMGFKPSFQEAGNLIETTTPLECRPCSVYGKGTCHFKENQFLCLTSISPEKVAKQIFKQLS